MKVHYPSDPLQSGLMYFLTPRKCTIFGVSCESLPRKVCTYINTKCKVCEYFYATDQLPDS